MQELCKLGKTCLGLIGRKKVEIFGMVYSWYFLPAMIGNNIPVVFSGFLMFDFGDHFTKTDVGILTPLT